MQALTIWQPWADAIAHGSKRTENRPWPAPPAVLGQDIAIHAGRTLDWEAEPPPGCAWPGLPAAARVRGAVIAVARLTGCHGPGCTAGPCSPWAAAGQFHWQLDQVRPLADPVPARGYQRLWTLSPALAGSVAAGVLASMAPAVLPVPFTPLAATDPGCLMCPGLPLCAVETGQGGCLVPDGC